jgi:hypothetical protein
MYVMATSLAENPLVEWLNTTSGPLVGVQRLLLADVQNLPGVGLVVVR